jgi:hypothetical protein
MAEIPVLRTDGRNWSAWRENLEWTLDELGISAYISETTPNPYDEQVNALAKCAMPPQSQIPYSFEFSTSSQLKNASRLYEFIREEVYSYYYSTTRTSEYRNETGGYVG